jgi:hypothetical protein
MPFSNFRHNKIFKKSGGDINLLIEGINDALIEKNKKFL